jgi:DsbC/DsbD-like thiol-disulfide interchange protein
MIRTSHIAVFVFFALTSLASPAQIVPTNPPARSPVAANAVTYLFPEQVSAPAGKPTPITLHFRVAPGLHINSHNPTSEFFIPTVLTFPADSGLHLDAAAYPAGVLITLAIDPGAKLSVYTGEFAIQARLIAAAGDHLVQGKLRYQACNDNECLPPKTIPVAIDVIGK